MLLILLIRWVALGVEALLLWRGVRGKLVARFPIFYGYILFVLLQSLLRLSVDLWWHGLYGPVFWVTEFLGLVIGSCVVFEVYRVALARYPGTARMARTALCLLFALAVARGLATLWTTGLPPTDISMLHVERALRTFQAVSIAALVAVFLFYSIPFGKNLRGILLGYALFIAMRVFALIFIAPRGYGFGFYAYFLCYPVILGVWLAHLWSLHSCPEVKEDLTPERGYGMIAAATRRKLRETRGYLRKLARP